MQTRTQLTRAALALALIGLAATITWGVLTREGMSWQGVAVLLSFAAVPIAAAALLFMKRRAGTTVAALASILGAVAGIALSFCLCSAPLSSTSVTALAVSGVVFALAMLDFVVLGMPWAAFGILVVPIIIGVSGNPPILIAALAIAGLMIWWLRRARRAPLKA